MSLDLKRLALTITITVLVQFRTEDGSIYQGDFKGVFKRLPQNEVEDMIDADPPMLNSEILDKVLMGVSGIASDGAELPADEQLAWVKRTPECVNAAVAAFFKELRPERYNEKTSGKRSKRG